MLHNHAASLAHNVRLMRHCPLSAAARRLRAYAEGYINAQLIEVGTFVVVQKCRLAEGLVLAKL